VTLCAQFMTPGDSPQPLQQPAGVAALLGDFLGDSKDFVVFTDLDGRVEGVNAAFRDALGLAEGEADGRLFETLMQADSAARWLAQVKMARQPGQDSGEFRATLISKDGGRVQIEGRLTLRKHGGRPIGLAGIFKDFTSRLEMEAELRRLALIAAHTDHPVVLTDGAGITLWVNAAFQRLTGYTMGEARGRSPGSLLKGPGTDPVTMLRTREQLKNRAPFTTEVLNYRKDGSSFWMHVDAQPIFRADGSLEYFIGVQRDITAEREQAARLERLVAERAAEIERQQRRMERMFELAPSPIFILDPGGSVRLINREAEHLLGCGRAVVAGRPFSDFIPAWRELKINEGGSESRIFKAKRNDGGDFSADLRLRTVEGDDGVALVASVRDVTREHRLDLMLATERLVLEKLANNAPLATILDDFVLGIEVLLPGAKGSVLLFETETSRLRHAAAPHLGADYCAAIDGLKAGEGVGSCGTAAHRKEAVIVADIATDPLWKDFTALAQRHGLRACWSVPVVSRGGEVLGTFAVYWDSPRRAAPEELEVLDRGAKLASLAIERRMLDAKIQRDEALLADGEKLAALGTWEYDASTGQGRWSDELFRLFGFEPAQSPPDLDAFLSRVRPGDRPTAIRAIEGMNRGECPAPTELHTLPASGGPRVMKTMSRPVEGEGGAVTKFLGVVQDVTELREAQEAVEAGRARLQKILESAPIALSLADASGAVKFQNQRFSELFGYTTSDVPTLEDWWERAFPDPAYRRMARTLRAELIADATRRDGVVAPSVLEVTCADGRLRTIEFFGVFLGGEYLCAFVDLTARIQAEQELRKFRSIADNASYGIAIASTEGYIQYVNESWAHMHGFDAHELTERHLSIFHAEDDMPTVRRLIRQLMDMGGYALEEVWHRRKNGSRFPTLMTGTLIRGVQGKPLYITGTCIDISERSRNRERIRIQNEVLTEIAGAAP
jgi:PAS domain S-box-containing protein